jgi:hypothetical protein
MTSGHAGIGSSKVADGAREAGGAVGNQPSAVDRPDVGGGADRGSGVTPRAMGASVAGGFSRAEMVGQAADGFGKDGGPAVASSGSSRSSGAVSRGVVAGTSRLPGMADRSGGLIGSGGTGRSGVRDVLGERVQDGQVRSGVGRAQQNLPQYPPPPPPGLSTAVQHVITGAPTRVPGRTGADATTRAVDCAGDVAGPGPEPRTGTCQAGFGTIPLAVGPATGARAGGRAIAPTDTGRVSGNGTPGTDAQGSGAGARARSPAGRSGGCAWA